MHSASFFRGLECLAQDAQVVSHLADAVEFTALLLFMIWYPDRTSFANSQLGLSREEEFDAHACGAKCSSLLSAVSSRRLPFDLIDDQVLACARDAICNALAPEDAMHRVRPSTTMLGQPARVQGGPRPSQEHRKRSSAYPARDDDGRQRRRINGAVSLRQPLGCGVNIVRLGTLPVDGTRARYEGCHPCPHPLFDTDPRYIFQTRGREERCANEWCADDESHPM